VQDEAARALWLLVRDHRKALAPATPKAGGRPDSGEGEGEAAGAGAEAEARAEAKDRAGGVLGCDPVALARALVRLVEAAEAEEVG
jgi:hypothetical protein